MLKTIGITCLLGVSLLSPVNAVPGQKFETAMKLYRNNPQLKNFTYGGTGGSLGTTHSYYTKLKQNESYSFKIYVDKNRKNVLIEAIKLDDASGIVLDRSSIGKLQVVKNVFNATIINDFKKSKYILKRTHYDEKQTSEFYEGKQFNYRIYRSPNHIDFAVISKTRNLQSIIFIDSVCFGAFFDCPG